ncbi:hypothetical protein [Sphingomonas aerolata]
MARDEAALARRYEQDFTRDIFKPPQAPEWNPLIITSSSAPGVASK